MHSTVVLVLVLILVLVLLKPVSLTNVLCEAVKTMNFIMSSPLRTHLVNNLYDVMGSTYKALCSVPRHEAQWLSRFGKVLL